jgi:hypothetical protein
MIQIFKQTFPVEVRMSILRVPAGKRFSVCSNGARRIPLLDVTGHWAEKEIRSLYENKIITGFADNSFQPEESIKKEEFIALLMKILNIPNVLIDNTEISDDVKRDRWSYSFSNCGQFFRMIQVKNNGDCNTFRSNSRIKLVGEFLGRNAVTLKFLV